jgi:Fur family peroxide stress response transcriptional regulator
MEKYKHMGLKLTPQRLAVLDFLQGNTRHPSAEEIYAAILKRFPTMSFATVYNTLDALRRKGEVRELTIDPGKKRFDPDTSLHHHLICVKCRYIADIFTDYELPVSENERAGFEIVGNHIEFYGVCPKCREQGWSSGDTIGDLPAPKKRRKNESCKG